MGTMQEKERDAFVSDLHRATSSDLHRYLAKSLGSKEAAADVAQEAYTKMFTLTEPALVQYPRAFLFKVAGRMALNYLRQSRRRHFDDPNVIMFNEHEHSMESGLGPEKITSHREELVVVDGALQSMSERTREVFKLHRFEGYTYGEIAERLVISNKTVEYHMSKALKHLMFHCGDIADPD